MIHLDARATFQRPERGRDQHGNIIEGWQDMHMATAGIRYLRGGEDVMAARLQSKMPAIVTVRNCAAARKITSEWRVTIRERSGIERLFDLKEDPRPTEGAAHLEMLVEARI